MMISCKKSSELICAGLDRDLSFRERLQLRMHLALCRACATFREQNDAIIEAIRRHYGDPEHGPATDPELEARAREACERIRQRLRAERGTPRE